MIIFDFLNELLGAVPAAFIAGLLPMVFIVPYALFAVYWERKVSAHMQDRLGPMRVGYHGLLQTIADILKLIQKEDIVASATDKPLFNIAPVLVFTGSYAAFAAIPFSSAYIGANVDLGMLFIIAASGLVVAGILMAGWASNNKYSMIGAVRSAAQIVSYEIPTVIIILTIFSMVGTLNLYELSEIQSSNIFNWFIFGGNLIGWKKLVVIPLMFASFIIIYLTTLAEVNRTPFDIPEAESELVAGYHTEYSGMKFAMFFLAEYANMFAVSAIVVALFLGGYHSPFGYLGNLIGLSWLVPIEQFIWFSFKGMLFVTVQMWLRWTLPRLRVDQLMTVCWKYLIPLSFLIFLLVSLLMVL